MCIRDRLITVTFGGSDLIVANILISLSVALICYAISRLILSHYISTTPNPDVEGKFAVLMIFTACSIAFAHGSNDVANAVGPMAAVISTIENLGSIEASSTVPEWVLLTGAPVKSTHSGTVELASIEPKFSIVEITAAIGPTALATSFEP